MKAFVNSEKYVCIECKDRNTERDMAHMNTVTTCLQGQWFPICGKNPLKDLDLNPMENQEWEAERKKNALRCALLTSRSSPQSMESHDI